MKKIRLILLAAGMMVSVASFMFSGCTKEGPAGPAGANGTDGTNGTNGQDGKDANETCKQCHTASSVDAISVEFQMAKHFWGITAFEEAGNASCGPCHEQKAFIYVCQNNIPATFTFNATTSKWVNDYSSIPSDAIGAISCWTCHSSLHTTYDTTDLAFTTVAPVPMTMWAGRADKTIDLPADGGSSNLCVKCHQPRPMTCANDPSGRLLNYDSLVSAPKAVQYDSATGAKNTGVRPSYRLHVHYGAIGGVYAGKGAVEFGTGYSNSAHTLEASCSDCHMASPMTGVAGGHGFNVRNGLETALGSGTTWNFNGCNVKDCHQDGPIDANSGKWKTTRSEVKEKLDALAAKINEAGQGHDILHAEADPASNLWVGVSTGNYDGYLDIYDPSTNAAGYWQNPYPAGSWTADQKAYNKSLQKFPKILNVQMGAMINFQFCLREYSLGIHNTQYVKTLMNNTLDALNANL